MTHYPPRTSSPGDIPRKHLQHEPLERRRSSDMVVQKERTPIKLPSISSITYDLAQSSGEAYQDLNHARRQDDAHYDATHPHEDLSHRRSMGSRWQHPNSGPSSSRSDVFMASLLRAAQSPDRQKAQSSPMSVHSMVDSTARTSENVVSRKRPFPQEDDAEYSHRLQESPADSYASIHHKIAMANPAAMAAHAQNTTFRPTPLRMSAPRSLPWNRPSYTSNTASYGPPPNISHEGGPFQPSQHDYATHARLLQRPSNSISSGLPRHQSHSSHSSSYTSSNNESPLSSLSSRDQRLISGSSADSSSHTSLLPSDRDHAAARSKSSFTAQHTEQNGPDTPSVAGIQERRWSSLAVNEKILHIRKSILLAWASFLQDSVTQPAATNVTTVRCMHANIAQKSYGSEKRFLCPPPSVRIVGPLRPCKWASARVVPGDQPIAGGSNQDFSMQAQGGSEEEAQIDPDSHEVRFGKLHVGSLSESKNKTFRLHISLFRSNEQGEDGAKWNAGSPSRGSLSHAPKIADPWFSFHTSTINVISKPARKSIRTRAASPAIASGSIVCLYNRLNSQTVRTKYLAVEGAEGKQTDGHNVHRLIARQEGWDAFSMELLAKPMCGLNASKASSALNDHGITYGSIICLRDKTTNSCSDPMMVCKVDKGRVDISGIVALEAEEKVRFLIAGPDQAKSRAILIGGSEKSSLSVGASATKAWAEDEAGWTMGSKTALSLFTSSDERRESNDSSTGSSTGPANNEDGPRARSPNNNGGSVGGAVIQMQKITLMHVLPRPAKGDDGVVECDFSLPRSYLCSTAFEGPSERQSKVALFRSLSEVQDNARARDRGVEAEASEEARRLREWPTRPIASSSLPCPVGYMRPPAVSIRAVEGGKYIDTLEDPFCWTVVTISQSTMSYIEANARPNSSEVHSPLTSAPVMPFPTMSRNSTYDTRSHCVSALIHDFYYSTRSGGERHRQHFEPALMPHEIWLGQSGPLSCQVQTGSMDGHVTDAIFQLPHIDHMLQLYQELLGQKPEQKKPGETSAERDVAFPPTELRLPILFVRPEQGLSFLSGYSIHLRRESSYTSSSWLVTIVH